MTLHELKSGKIELVRNGPWMLLQFNCNCEDALPYCEAMCCRLKVKYNVALTEEEAKRLGGREAQNGTALKVLPWKPNLSADCQYLDEQNSCSVQKEKPQACREWHCSPGGNKDDPTVIRRDGGWVCLPARI